MKAILLRMGLVASVASMWFMASEKEAEAGFHQECIEYAFFWCDYDGSNVEDYVNCASSLYFSCRFS